MGTDETPRVMAWSELAGADHGYGVMECIEELENGRIITDLIEIAWLGNHTLELDRYGGLSHGYLSAGAEHYGENGPSDWRIWTSRPTEEDRKRVKWDG